MKGCCNLKEIFRVTVLACLIFVTAGCAPKTVRPTADPALVALEAKKQHQLALRKIVNYRERLAGVSYRTRAGGADLCGKDITSTIGAVFSNKYSYGDDLQDAAVENLGVGENLKVVHVVPAGAASSGGIEIGDELVSVDDTSAPVGDRAILELANILENLSYTDITSFVVRREDENVQLEIQLTRSCAYPVLLTASDDVNAYADGNVVYITRGMMRFVQSDNQLALVVGHELAHNAMGHMTAKTTNYWLGTVLDIVAAGYGVDTQNTFGRMASSAYSQGFESEADYVGLYFVARGGYEIDDAPNFWREMAVAHPGSITTNHAASHPATPERFVALEKTVGEIQEKQINQVSLNPKMKK